MRFCCLLFLLAASLHADERLPNGVLARLGRLGMRHRNGVTAVALSPDGKLLASAGDDKTLRLWDVDTGLELRRLPELLDRIICLRFSPDGRTLASIAVNQVLPGAALRLWDVSSGKERFHHFGAEERFSTLAFSPDGKLLATADNGFGVRLWDTSTGKLSRQLSGLRGQAIQFVFSPTGHSLRTVDDADTLHEWPLDDKGDRRRFRFPVDPDNGHRQAAVSADGRVVYSGKGDNTTLQLWQPGEERPQWKEQRHEGRSIRAIVFSANDKYLLSAGDEGAVVLWHSSGGKVLQRLSTTPATPEVLAFSGDGTRIAAGCEDGSLYVWQAGTGKVIQPDTTLPSGVHSLAWSPDGSLLAAGMHAGSIRLWDTATRTERATLTQHRDSVVSLEFSADGTLLASAGRDRTATVWSVKTGKPVRSLTGFGAAVTCVAFSQDGTLLAASSQDRENGVRLWDMATGRQRPLLSGNLRNSWLVAFSSDGRRLLAAGNLPYSGGWEAWDVTTHDPAPGAIDSFFGSSTFTCSRDGRTLVSVSYHEREALIWEVAASRLRRRLKLDEEASELALTRDGRFLAVNGAKAVTVWDLATGKRAYRFSAQPSKVYALAFAPDSKTLAIGYTDSTTLLWDVSACSIPLTERMSSEQDFEMMCQSVSEPDPERAYEAMWKLAATRSAATQLRERILRGWKLDDQDVARCIADLDARRFRVREAAEQQLERWGLDAVPALERILTQKPSLEMRRRVERVLPKAQARGANPERVKISRGIEALERMATKEARQELIELARGPKESLITREAQAALAR